MASLQHTVGNKILITSGTAALIARECCCTTNPCASGCAYPNGCCSRFGTYATSPGPWNGVQCPSMLVTVSDGSYPDASGNLNWAGQTWTPAEVRAGNVQKTACPSLYAIQQHRLFVGTIFYYDALHQWRAGAAATVLFIGRKYFAYGFGGSCFNGTIQSNVQLNNVISYDNRACFGFGGGGAPPCGPFGFCPTSIFNLGLISGVAQATMSDYKLTPTSTAPASPFFNTVTIGTITYTWAKGADWP